MIQKRTIPVVGMACSSCSAHVQSALRSLQGVSAADVSLTNRTADVTFDDALVTPEQMKAAVNAIGFDLVTEQNRSIEAIEHRALTLLRCRTLLAWLLAVAVMALSMGWVSVGSASVSYQSCLILTVCSMVACGRQFYVNAFRQLCHGMASMDTLIAFSTLMVVVASLCGASGLEGATMIIAFVLAGRLLEERARRATASSIRTLMGLQPKTARLCSSSVKRDDAEELSMVPISTISIGDCLEVRAGEKIPVDGTVTWATSFMNDQAAYVDESMITGEPTPVMKSFDATARKLLAGTIVQQGTLRMRATQVGEHTALAQIIQMVRQAQGSKAPVQRVVDRLAAVFVPVVAGLALLTFVLWIVFGGSVEQAVMSAVAVLVIACPCAMGLATPTALTVAIGKAAEQGILIKDAAAIEQLRKATAIVLDKTGTLTIPNQHINFTMADTLPFEEREQLKPHAREAVDDLRQRGLTLWMMSGDRDDAAAYWAAKAGISNYQSNVKPQDKENLVRRLQGEGHCVAMVGDGINDSQALALADVGIAIGTGTDVAMDVAQLTLMGDDLRTLPRAFALSRRTVGMIRQNLFWAFVYNLVCIPLAAGLPHAFGLDFLITPMWASALMALSSISVVLNSLRLRFSS